MLPEEARSQAEKTSGEQFERKLWLEYLSRRIDRALRLKAGRGATSWVLVGILAAIVLKCAPLIPVFWATPGAVSAAVIAAAVEVDLWLCARGFLELMLHRRRPTARLWPRWARDYGQLLDSFSLIVFGLALTLHILAILSGPPRFAMVVLVIFGLFWAASCGFSLSESIRERRRSAGAKELARVAGGTRTTAGGEAVATGLTLLVLASGLTVALGIALRQDAQGPEGWLLPLAASAYFLVSVGILWELLMRAIREERWDAYRWLEADILLEGLGPSQIRERFLDELLVKPVTEWLSGKQEEMTRLEGEISSRLEAARGTSGPPVPAASRQTGNLPTGVAEFASEQARQTDSLCKQYASMVRAFDDEIAGYMKGRSLPDGEKLALGRIVSERKDSLARICTASAEIAEMAKRAPQQDGQSGAETPQTGAKPPGSA